MVLVSYILNTMLVFYKLNSAIEKGTKPDALGRKPCHCTRTLKGCNRSLPKALCRQLFILRAFSRFQMDDRHRLGRQVPPMDLLPDSTQLDHPQVQNHLAPGALVKRGQLMLPPFGMALVGFQGRGFTDGV